MTIYLPKLPENSASKADRIAAAIANDIRAGRLKVRDKLPTHRDLGRRLGVTPGTVSRAYALLERQGLLSGEVGRGTFVADPNIALSDLTVAESSSDASAGRREIDLAINRRASHWVEAALAQTLRDLSREKALGSLMCYQPDSGMDRHRAALANWFGQNAFTISPEHLIITAGAQHAAYVIFSVLAAPSDVVLVEEFTYAGFKALADELRLQLEPVQMDAQGLIPEDLEKRAKATGAKWLYTMPQMHNPTAAMLSAKRRAEVLRIAAKYDFRIVEDGVYDFLRPEPVSPLAAADPERVFYITSFSKSLAPGLRIGCLVSPARWVDRLSRAIRRSMWMIPALGAELCVRWIIDGRLDGLIARQRDDLTKRSAVLKSSLSGSTFTAPLAAAFAWIALPPEISSGAVIGAAQEHGIRLAPTEAFTVRRNLAARYLRLNLSASDTIEELQGALNTIAPLLVGDTTSGRDYY